MAAKVTNSAAQEYIRICKAYLNITGMAKVKKENQNPVLAPKSRRMWVYPSTPSSTPASTENSRMTITLLPVTMVTSFSRI